ncbi:MAG TPA: PAS domain S-box protein [Syntrophales bacterium]|nr:PAS domain S-box protein [Syntrophales bacterium]
MKKAHRKTQKTNEERLLARVAELESQLAEAEETLRAIREGEVDALVVETSGDDRIYTLAGAEHPYRVMIESMREGAATLTLDGTIIFCNERFADIIKLPLEKVIGSSVYPFIQPEDIGSFKTLISQGLEGLSGKEILFQTGDGTSVPTLTSCSGLEVDVPGSFCIVVTDISIRKKAEELYRILSEQSFAGVYVVQDGKFRFINARGASYAGYSPQEMIGKDADFMLHPEDKDRAKRCAKEMLKGRNRYPYEFRIITRQKEIRWIAETVTPISYDGKRAVLGNSMDFSEHKRYEEEIRRANEKLRAMASEMVLIEDAARRQFATVLHESVAQTLAAIRMKLEFLQECLSPDGLGEMAELRHLVNRSIHETRTIMSDLNPPILYELGFIPALEWLAEQFEAKHRIRVDFKRGFESASLPHDLIIILFQSTRELLMNVIKHAEAKNAAIAVSQGGNDIMVEVSDDGIGFDMIKMGFHTDLSRGFGLFSIRERLKNLGGQLEI